MKLIILYGPPAVGKLTVAEELAALTGYKVFHNHLTVDLALAFFEFGTRQFGRYLDHLRFDAFETAVREGVPGLIFTFVYSYGLDDRFVQDVIETVESNGGEVCLVQLTCDRKELDHRVVLPARERFHKIKTVEKLGELLARYDLFKPMPFPNNLTINTTNLPPQDAARTIVQHFQLPTVSTTELAAGKKRES